MRGASLVLWLLAALAAGALTIPEVLPMRGIPNHTAAKTWLRKTVSRALALGLLGSGLLHLLAILSQVVWHDHSSFLLRAAPPLPSDSWLGPWLWACLGLFWCALSLPPAVVTALAWSLAATVLLEAVAVVRLLALRHGRVELLLGIALVVAVPAALVGYWTHRQTRPDSDESLRLPALLSAAGLALCTPLFASVAWVDSSWPKLLPLFVAGPLLALWLPAGSGAGSRWQDLASHSHALMQLGRTEWLRVAGLLVVLQWSVAVTALPLVGAEGRRVLDRVADWPQLLTGQANPRPSDWRPVAQRIQDLTVDYRGHPWCGQWLLLLAWIQSQQLGQPYTARVFLLDCAHNYPSARATPPPFWARRRTAGEIAAEMLKRWGSLVDPGSHPA